LNKVGVKMQVLKLLAISGLVLFGALNAEAAAKKCPKGQHWDKSMKMCMPDKKSSLEFSAADVPVASNAIDANVTAPKKCPAGQHYDPAMKMCMPDKAPASPSSATFSAISKKVFSQECTMCHMVMGPKDPAEAGIDFSSFAAMTASNDSKTNPDHAPFIIAGDPEHSKLYLAAQGGKMPMKEDGTPGVRLTAADVQDIYDWIKAGALNN
jgi:hypothetical protein